MTKTPYAIEWKKGDIFTSKGTITIPVNIMGALGAGLALQAKNRYSDLNFEYRKLCFSRDLDIGIPQLACGNKILLFPTKKHWKDDSEMEYLDSGLLYLSTALIKASLKCKNNILALPKLGCGLGNLDWPSVGKLIESYLKDVPIKIEVYGERP